MTPAASAGKDRSRGGSLFTSPAAVAPGAVVPARGVAGPEPATLRGDAAPAPPPAAPGDSGGRGEAADEVCGAEAASLLGVPLPLAGRRGGVAGPPSGCALAHGTSIWSSMKRQISSEYQYDA